MGIPATLRLAGTPARAPDRAAFDKFDVPHRVIIELCSCVNLPALCCG
jgi:hypothetical protein